MKTDYDPENFQLFKITWLSENETILPKPGKLLSNRENSDCGQGKGVSSTFSAGHLV